MGFPIEKVSKSRHVDIDIVSSMLRRRHAGKFMVWNLRFAFLLLVFSIREHKYLHARSEKKYDYSKFDNNVREYTYIRNTNGCGIGAYHAIRIWCKR